MLPWTNDVNHHLGRRFTQLQIEKAYEGSDFYFWKHGTVLTKRELVDAGFETRVLSKWERVGLTKEKVSADYGFDIVWRLVEGSLPDCLLYSQNDYK